MKFTSLEGVGHDGQQSWRYKGDDPKKGYTTAYASDRPDKTEDVWDWHFKQKR